MTPTSASSGAAAPAASRVAVGRRILFSLVAIGVPWLVFVIYLAALHLVRDPEEGLRNAAAGLWVALPADALGAVLLVLISPRPRTVSAASARAVIAGVIGILLLIALMMLVVMTAVAVTGFQEWGYLLIVPVPMAAALGIVLVPWFAAAGLVAAPVLGLGHVVSDSRRVAGVVLAVLGAFGAAGVVAALVAGGWSPDSLGEFTPTVLWLALLFAAGWVVYGVALSLAASGPEQLADPRFG